MAKPQFYPNQCNNCNYYKTDGINKMPIGCADEHNDYDPSKDGVPCPGYTKSIENKKGNKLKELSGN